MVLNQMNLRFFSMLAGGMLAGISVLASAVETAHVIHPETGIHTWEQHDQGVGFTLMQITPDQARAFFLARGFDRPAVDHYASSCVFMTIVRNESVAEPISNNLADWRVHKKNSKTGKLKLASDWLKEWKRRGVSASALIAFEWSQFPQQQTFEMGDWNQGMTTYALPLGSVFDLGFVWRVNGVKYETKLESIRCASVESDR